MLDDWLGELAFVHYWRVLEERGAGIAKAPEFTQLSPAERQAWIEAAKAIEEQVRRSSLLGTSLDTRHRIRETVPPSYSTRRAMKGSARDARRAGT